MPWLFNWLWGTDIDARLQRIEEFLAMESLVAAERFLMAQADIDRLKAEVAENTAVVDSAIVLITGMADKIRELADDPVELAALADELDASAAKLGAAVAENTPTPPPVEEPPVEPTPEV
jgi:hypothetical protein